MLFFLSRTAFFAAAVLFINGRPSAFFGFVFAHAALFVTFFDVFGLAFLFVGVCRIYLLAA